MLLVTLYREIVRQRLALYQGVCPVHMEFSDCAEKTFGDACSYLLVITDISYPFCFFAGISLSGYHGPSTTKSLKSL
jgi:hypothetical protein